MEIGMFHIEIDPILHTLVKAAKMGDLRAKEALKEHYSLRVYTFVELEEINKLIQEEGLNLDQAIKRVNGG
jgi:tRNA G37 N-methylase Trm5